MMYSAVAADDVILRAPACRGTKNPLFPQRIADLKEKQILRCAQDDSIAFCYAATLKTGLGMRRKDSDLAGQDPQRGKISLDRIPRHI